MMRVHQPLLNQIQQATEQLYRRSLGVDLAEFIIPRSRFLALSRLTQQADELSDQARVFMRVNSGRLHMAIYYNRHLINALEQQDPRKKLNESNIRAFSVFIEEINHAIHAGLKFRDGQSTISHECFLTDLELQARIDVYFLLKFFLARLNLSGQMEKLDRLWLRHHVFERENTEYRCSRLAKRYRTAVRLGERFSRFIESLPTWERQSELMRFRALAFGQKTRYIDMLPC